VWERASSEQVTGWQKQAQAEDQFFAAQREREEIDDQLEHASWTNAQNGRWAEAAAELAHAIQHNPANHQLWQWLGAIDVQTGQLDAYREHCRKSMELFSQTTDFLAADRIAKTCLILPGSGASLSALSAMADAAVTRGQHTTDFPYFQLCKGLAEYRQSRFASATDWMGKVLTNGMVVSNAGNFLELRNQAEVLLAMSQYQLGQIEQARASLTQGAEIEKKLPKADSGDLGNWYNWIVAHAFMNEAKSMIESPPAVAEPNSPARRD
jgi:tetratricopeptide (TPR) repeat protein